MEKPLLAVALVENMQQPTCTNIRIRSTRDAHIIFHAVSLNILPIISRRLDADERAALRSGCVYAWEERGPHTEVTGLGIERFTEGRRWGPSRVRDVSFCHQKWLCESDNACVARNSCFIMRRVLQVISETKKTLCLMSAFASNGIP